MFCYQCEQAANGEGCTKMGVCGKDPELSALQDLLIYSLKGLSLYAVEGRKFGIVNHDVNLFLTKGLFSTLTNVDFDSKRFEKLIHKSFELRESLKAQVRAAGGKTDFAHGSASYKPELSLEGLVKQGRQVVERVPDAMINPDIQSLQDILLFGLKGVAAYADHAEILGKTDDSIYAFMSEALAAMTGTERGLNEWIGLVLKCGEVNLKTMEILDGANTGAYGHPVPTRVPLGTKKGKAILVSGHDLKDLETILKQSEGKGINIYTHGEMLPAHGYPGLKKYAHFYGHYGTAWQNQHKEFARFPGAIVMTTNCIQKPLASYRDNLFTCGLVGWPDVVHITDGNFMPVIEKALSLRGFTADTPGKEVMAGFARNSVLGVADKVIAAVKEGKIRHFFLVGGCDGAKPGRNYYTEFVEKTPKDTIVLTLACGKFRFFDKELGDVGGIPRLLDIGQCNDAYSAIQIAVALSKAFNIGVNDLPLSLVLSWYEQKAVAILLSLLHLGIKDIRLGPTLPAFITPTVLEILVKNFGIRPIGEAPEADLEEMLGPCWSKTKAECLAADEVTA
ncbi:MAG TPA: hydroxylamine reductase [Nitrospirota bacterium]|nr:hydroxylamine reductase [Nitrospirota bacterium]